MRKTFATPMARRRPRARLTYANVTATLALFLALGGVSYAALKIPPNSVGPRQIQKNAVGSTKLQGNSVTSAKVADSSLLRKDFAPDQLPTGERGPQGPPGDPASVPQDVIGKNATLAAGITNSTSYTDLGGPSVTLTVGAATPGVGYIEIAASGTLTSPASGNAVAALFEDGQIVDVQRCNGQTNLLSASSGSTQTAITAFGFQCGASTGDTAASPSTLLVKVTPGSHTYSLRYATMFGSGTSSFQNVTLWVRAAS